LGIEQSTVCSRVGRGWYIWVLDCKLAMDQRDLIIGNVYR
jgi:hypothetical protein